VLSIGLLLALKDNSLCMIMSFHLVVYFVGIKCSVEILIDLVSFSFGYLAKDLFSLWALKTL
jgi:hypothetical protein